MNKLRIFIALTAILFPAFVFAKAGTASYLRDVLHLPESRFTEELDPEERKPFAFTTAAGKIEDPIGDVLDRKGVEAKFSAAWGDLSGASLSKDETIGMWVVEWRLADAFPLDDKEHKIQFLFYADQNGLPEDNAPSEGVRGDMDTEWSVERDESGEWVTNMRWYNKSADFWALDRKTESLQAITYSPNGQIDLRIPFVELPKDAEPHWRVIAAVADAKSETQIDVAPGIGFPPSRMSDEETLTAKPGFKLSDIPPAVIILAAGALIILAYVINLRLARRRKA